MTESLQHKELKKKAIEELQSMGFTTKQTETEQWVYFNWEGKERRYRVDALGDNGQRKVIFQVGNHGKIEIDLLKKFFETHYIPYPLFDPYPKIKSNKEESLTEKKNELFRTYKEIVKHFKNDEVYDMIEYNEENKQFFKIGLDNSWMLLPHTTTYGKDEIMDNINICFVYAGDGLFSITINAEMNNSIKLFLDIITADKEKYIEEVNKLSSGYYIQDGYKYREPGAHFAQRMPRNWEDVQPYHVDSFSMEDLEDIEERLKFWLDSSEEKYPIFSILSAYMKKDEILMAFQQMRPVYKILKTMRTYDKSRAENIKNISDWKWYILEKEYDNLYELYCDKYKDEKIKYSDFKLVINLLKKDKEYLEYAKE